MTIYEESRQTERLQKKLFSMQTEINHLEFGVGSYPAGPTDRITVQINTELKLQE